MWVKRIVNIVFLSCLVTVSFLLMPSPAVQALSIDDYFVYTYDFSFSKTTVTGSETFILTMNGQATCIQNIPGGASEAYVETKVVASLDGTEVILNPGFTLSYTDFPDEVGEQAESSVQVPLSFPVTSSAGTYTVTGYIITARVRVVLGIWITVTGYLPASQSIGMITYQPVTGGGGGSTEPNPATNLSRFMDDNGIFLEDAQALSVDKTVTLIFSQGTLFTVPGGTGSTVIIKSVEKGAEPEPPENCLVFGQAYNIEPEGANFSLPIKMIFSYDETILLPGAHEKDIFLAWWDSTIGKWMPLENCEVDDINNMITGLVEHFTMFAMIIDMSPPVSIDISSLIVDPLQVKSGESVTVTLTVENTGDRTGTITIVLKINDIEEATRDIILDSGVSKIIKFIIFRNAPGTYSLNINGLDSSFVVVSSSPSATEPTSLPTESSSGNINQESDAPVGSQSETSTDTPSSDTEEKPDQLPSESTTFAWWQVLMALAIGMMIGGLVLLFLRRSRRV